MDLMTGNAARDGEPFRGWFIGHFVPADLARSDHVEVKWGVHARDESRTSWASNTRATTLSVLVTGRFRLHFDGRDCMLSQPGDYALWGPGVAHRWQAEADDTVVLTVRWPSLAGDAREQ